MKQGTTPTKRIKLDIDISLIDSVIFAIKSANALLIKRYPTEISYADGAYWLNLTQEETQQLSNICYIEAQINLVGGAVAKSDVQSFYAAPTLHTEIMGAQSGGADITDIKLQASDAIMMDAYHPPYIGTNGNWYQWDSVAKIFADSGLPSKGERGATGLQGIQGLKGDTGSTGPKGDKGDTGDIGLTGAQGIQGVKGDKGDAGLQGVQGAKGDTGTPGYTPQRGVDYWTAEDIAGIHSYIDTQIGGALDGSY